MDLRVDSRWFDEILKGNKIVEGRIFKERYSDLEPGDIIKFRDKDRVLSTFLLKINRYPNFRDMLVNEGLENVLPGVDSVEEGVKVYETYYPNNMVSVLALRIAVIND